MDSIGEIALYLSQAIDKGILLQVETLYNGTILTANGIEIQSLYDLKMFIKGFSSKGSTT